MLSSFEKYQSGRSSSDDIVTREDFDAKAPPEIVAMLKNATMQEKAMELVYSYVKERLEKTDTHVTFTIENVYAVWFSKTIQNWKTMISTTLPDGMYYEVTYNGDKCETYIDAYKKFDNVCIPDK